MNISGKRKHHIWTVVINRNRMLGCGAVLFCFILMLSLINIPMAAEEKILIPLAQNSLKSLYPSNTETAVLSHFSKPEIEDILRVSSPLFSSDSPRDMQSEKEKSTENKNSKEAKENTKGKAVSEKSITSKSLEITNATSFFVDPKSLCETSTSYKAIENGSKVLIVHTHGCETYSDKNNNALGEGGSYRTTDKGKNVTSVGKVLADELGSRGISVIYDDTLCDYPSYNSSYKNSMQLIEKYKKEHPDIRFVFDIHRDAISDSNGDPVKLTAKVGNEVCAQAMIVCGTDASGLYHPNWRENLILGLKIQKKLEEKYPGLARPLNLREERFNMHETAGSLIFEIGTHGNTLEEAKKTAAFLADAVCEVICN